MVKVIVLSARSARFLKNFGVLVMFSVFRFFARSLCRLARGLWMNNVVFGVVLLMKR